MTVNSKNTYSNLLYRSPTGRASNNCWAYAIDHYDTEQGIKLQPGELSGKTSPMDLSTCDDVVQRAIDDATAMGWTLTPSSPSSTCSKHHYHIMAVLAPDRDYHWYRFHKNVLYRVQTPRSKGTIAKEFGVPETNVQIPGPDENMANTGDTVLVRDARVWSHKRGLSEDGPLLKDACGKFIKNPAKACRAYPGLDYSVVCKTFCLSKTKNT